MSMVFASVLVVAGLLLAVVLAAAVPAFFTMLALDARAQRQARPRTESDRRVTIAVERGVARGFVVAGGAFWSIAAFAGLYSYQENGVAASLMAALIPTVACAATLIVGWYFERTTAALLALLAFAVIPYGIIFQFEMGVWALMVFALIGPMLTASVLFWAARREQEAYELATASRAQLAFIFAARSSLAA